MISIEEMIESLTVDDETIESSAILRFVTRSRSCYASRLLDERFLCSKSQTNTYEQKSDIEPHCTYRL